MEDEIKSESDQHQVTEEQQVKEEPKEMDSITDNELPSIEQTHEEEQLGQESHRTVLAKLQESLDSAKLQLSEFDKTAKEVMEDALMPAQAKTMIMKQLKIFMGILRTRILYCENGVGQDESEFDDEEIGEVGSSLQKALEVEIREKTEALRVANTIMQKRCVKQKEVAVASEKLKGVTVDTYQNENSQSAMLDNSRQDSMISCNVAVLN